MFLEYTLMQLHVVFCFFVLICIFLYIFYSFDGKVFKSFDIISSYIWIYISNTCFTTFNLLISF